MTRSIHQRSLIARVFTTSVVFVLLVSFAGIGYAAPGDKGNHGEDPPVETVAPGPEVTGPAPEAEEPPAEAESVEPAPAPAPDEVEEEPVIIAAREAGEHKTEVEPLEVAPPTAPPVVSPAVVAPATARSDFPDPVTVGEGCSYTTIALFWAGQNYESGTVSANNDADNLYITFTTTGGWVMTLSHLYVGLVPPASEAPGSFPYQTIHNPAVTSYVYTIPLAGLEAEVGDTIYIAAHAEVSKGEQDETAWAGTGTWPGLGFAHVIQECEPPDLKIIKYNDLNGNGEWDDSEPVIPGIPFSATLGATVLNGTTDASGTVLFAGIAAGTWTIDETLPAGWVATTEIPLDVAVVAGQDATVYVGNREIEITKTFRLHYPAAPDGVTFYASYSVDDVTATVELLGDSPYEAQVKFPYGTEITVSWYALYGSEMVLLGGGEPEILTEDTLNEFTYGASASGYKFNDLDADGVWDLAESGMGGWTISLYREMPDAAGFALYAVTSTATDGSYAFDGLLPGTYYVAEEDRTDWFMTVGPEGTFVITNGSGVDGLTFGNTEEPFVPFTFIDLAIEKAASVEKADPGQYYSYTLTYRNLGNGVATDFRIVDDFDARYLTVVDSGGGEVVGGTIVWELAGPLSMDDGERTLTYTVRVIVDMPDGVTNIDNVVVISHPDDENLTNNTADDVVVVDNPALPYTEEDEDDPFLPFTGGDSALLLGMMALTAALGGALRRKGHRIV